MKNHNPSGGNLRFAGAGQRLTAMLVLLVFAGLLWAAWSGHFDSEIQHLAAWLRRHYQALVH